MTIFRNVVLLAAAAGLLAGLIMALMQLSMTTPLILKAELFETAASQGATAQGTPAHGAASHGGTAHRAEEAGAKTTGSAAKPTAKSATSAHQHNEAAWQPADGLERTAYTVLANVTTAIGFALLLIVASELAGGLHGWRHGLIWGFAGFAVFTLAPGLGLPPELPAMPTADLMARQGWWLGTVVATAAGLALIIFQRHWVLAAIGALLIVTPHFIGAPQPVDHNSPIPADLLHDFIVISTITSLIFWMVLGVAVGALRRTILQADDPSVAPAAAPAA